MFNFCCSVQCSHQAIPLQILAKKLRWCTKSQEDVTVRVQEQALSQGDL